MRARDWILLALGCAAGAGGVWYWKSRPAPALENPAARAQGFDPNSEPASSSGREPVYLLRTEKPAEPPATVDRRWARLNREAIEALEAGRHDRAVELFDECVQAVPGEPIFAANLAEALARLSASEYARGTEDDKKLALQHLARASGLAPERADLKKRLEQLQRVDKAEEGFWTESSEHFQLAYDGERRDLLMSSYEVTQMLEAAYQEFGERFARYPVENGRPKIRVVLYKRDGFHEATGIGHWAGGLYDGTVRVPIENLGRDKMELERVLRHEIVHAFVAEAGGSSVPGWLNEGLAQWLESSTLERQSAVVRAARTRIQAKGLLGLDRMQNSLGDQKEAEAIGFAYAESLAFTAYIDRVFGERVLFDMVSGCQRKAACENTFRLRTGVDLSAVLSDLARELD